MTSWFSSRHQRSNVRDHRMAGSTTVMITFLALPLMPVFGLPPSMPSLSNLPAASTTNLNHMFMHLTDTSVAADTGCPDAYTLILTGLVLCSGEHVVVTTTKCIFPCVLHRCPKCSPCAVDFYSIPQWRHPSGHNSTRRGPLAKIERHSCRRGSDPRGTPLEPYMDLRNLCQHEKYK
jgi:hypothetical protein